MIPVRMILTVTLLALTASQSIAGEADRPKIVVIPAAAHPDWWIAKDTWWETMWESLNAASARAKADRTDGFKPFTSQDALWRLVEERFPDSLQEINWEREDGIWNRPGNLKDVARRYADACSREPEIAREAKRLAAMVLGRQNIEPIRRLYLQSRSGRTEPEADQADVAAVRMAVLDLMKTFPQQYARGPKYLERLDRIEKVLDEVHRQGSSGGKNSNDPMRELSALRREALLGNPLLDFDRLLLIKRRPIKGGKPVNPDTSFGWDIGLPRSSAGNSGLPKDSFDDEIAVLSPVAPDGELTTLFKPQGNKFVGDVDLHFSANRMLFSMRDADDMFRIYEIKSDGSGPRQVSRGDQPDVDDYDACYLPDGRIVYAGTGCFQGVPCNMSNVAVLYRMDADGSAVRQLCFEQDHDFNPCILPSGRVLYTRWEYSDLPHSNSRMMFSMNPDGTSQMEYYGSGSYWPNSVFGARPIPHSPHKFIGIVAGHHGSHREGELVLFDAGQGRREADGVVQRIPGRGQTVAPLVRDQLTAASWPKFAHPYPLSDKYFLVTCKLDSQSPWDIYLVDVFDNLLPLYHLDGYALFEPIPLRKTNQPPVIPERVDPKRKDAVVHLADIYRGGGLAGVPRGTVKELRLFTYHFAYQGMGGLLGVVGLDGPWDIKRVLGTVPVEADGSAQFRIPANVPISLQPLDEDGKAVQLMRSWLVGMPGETVSCIGCHERQTSTGVNLNTLADRRKPSEIAPWYGPPRNFSFKREVQPVVDRYCTGCHNGAPERAAPDLSGVRLTSDYKSIPSGNPGKGGPYFSESYFQLSRYVRRPGIESDIHMLKPMEYHADTTELVQMLARGHHNVKLDAEAWDRLITWIDLNAPYHGTWTEIGWDPGPQRLRRSELKRLYAGVEEDPESLVDIKPERVEPLMPEPLPKGVGGVDGPIEIAGWPFDAGEAARRQAAVGLPARRTVDLGDGVTLDLALIPPGEFIMGDPSGETDQRPAAGVRIEKPFWIGTTEITNRQYAQFDPAHDSRFESKNGYQFGVTGFEVNRPQQPVVRVSWHRAMSFCAWLSKRLGELCTLPTEAQWEYAGRSGSDAAFSFGELGADFSPFANTADAKLQQFTSDPHSVYHPLEVFTPYDDWIPRDGRFDDRGLVTIEVAGYRPNAWGLFDMHGNAAEWTRSAYRPYPYDPHDGREDASGNAKRTVRGGSWRDRPKNCGSAFRVSYQPWQGVYNVGFRVVCETGESP
jgi:formylglycine-generating enzyme required for sulfatase activity